MRKILFILLFVLTGTMYLYAGGYQVRLQGARQTGMGLTGTSLAAGASDIFYNPGALGFLNKKFEFTAGVNAIMARIHYRSVESDYHAQTDNPISPPLFIYGAGQITDRLAVGLGIYTPFGSKSVWPDDWKGRFLIQNIGMRAYYIQPTLSYKILDNLGFGAGFVFMYGKVDLQKALNYGPDAYAQLSGSTTAYGYNLGVFYKPVEQVNLGINYRSEITVGLEGGDATFFIPQSIAANIPTANKFSAELPMPANLDFGITVKACEKLLVSLELNWVMWSTYDTLTFTFEEKGELLNSKNPRLYKDSFIPRLGLEYTLNDKIQLRTGAYYDASPIPVDNFNPETVSLNTLAFTFGLTYKPIENLKIDLSLLQLMGAEEERSYGPANFSGIYKSNTTIPGIGITYNF